MWFVVFLSCIFFLSGLTADEIKTVEKKEESPTESDESEYFPLQEFETALLEQPFMRDEEIERRHVRLEYHESDEEH